MLQKLVAMSKLLQVICLTAFLSFPIFGQAQDEVTDSLDTYIEQLKNQCPFSKGDNWIINSVETVVDTVTIEIVTPGSLSSFMSLLIVDNEKGKRLWVQHLSEYGEPWKRLAELTAQEERFLIFALKPQGGRKVFYLYCSPDELGAILARN